MMNYIAYRVFEFFSKKDNKLSTFRTINFLILFQISFLVPLFIFLNSIVRVNLNKISSVDRIEYYIGIPLAVILILTNSFFLKKQLKGERLTQLKEKFHREHYSLSIWIIFITPIVLTFIIPVLYGILNGTIRVH